MTTNTVKPVLTTTSEQQPSVNNDHSKTRPSNFSTKVISENDHLSTTTTGHLNMVGNEVETCLQRPLLLFLKKKYVEQIYLWLQNIMLLSPILIKMTSL